MTIHQSATLPASPDRIYTLLLDSAQFTAATGGRTAEIGHVEGAAFSLFGGPIHGRQIELVPNRRIVQAWRAANWPAGTYSIVQFTLAPDGAGTKLTLDHSGYPDDQHDHLSSGWEANYFAPFAKFFAK
jgi:activator of HSP90 ATPase